MKKSKQLKKIQVEEVSLVGRPANRRPFLFIKGITEMKDLIKLIKEFAGDYEFDEEDKSWNDVEEADKLAIGEYLADGELFSETEIEKAGLSDKAIMALKACYSVLNRYKAEIPRDLMSAMMGAIKGGSKNPYPAPYKKGDPIEIPIEDCIEYVAKSGKKLSTETRTRLTEIITSLQDLIPKEEEEKKDTTSDVGKEITKSIEMLNKSITEQIEEISKRITKLEVTPSVESKKTKPVLKLQKESTDTDPYPSLGVWFDKEGEENAENEEDA